MKLHNDYKIPFGENGISHTWAKHTHYYLCENRNNVKYLNKIHADELVQSFE